MNLSSLTAHDLLNLRNSSAEIIKENDNLKSQKSELEHRLSLLQNSVSEFEMKLNQIRIKTVELERLENQVNDTRKQLQDIKKNFLYLQQESLSEELKLKELKRNVALEYESLSNIKKYKEQFV